MMPFYYPVNLIEPISKPSQNLHQEKSKFIYK